MPARIDRRQSRSLHLVWIASALALVGLTAGARSANGQDLEPRSYVNTPVGLNFLIAGYGYTQGDVVFSESAPVKDAQVHTNAGFLAYVRALDVWGLSGKVALLMPYASASGSAKLNGQERERNISGLADPRLRLSVNLYGAPALTLKEFDTYQQDLIIGATVEVSAPLGQYDSSKLLNIGTNRWSVKPEIGVSKALGRLTLELSGAATFFTNNNDFLNGKTLEQAPVYSFQAHTVYELRNGAWVSLDATYYAGGRTTIDGQEGDRLEHVRLGLTTAIPINRYNSVKLFGSTGVYSRTGADFWAVGAAWQLRWGGGF